MNGYDWHHFVRITPTDGIAETLDLREEFRGSHGPTSTAIRYEQDADNRRDINGDARQNHRGYRIEVDLTFEITDIENEQPTLARICNALTASSRGTIVELSLDGGFTWRKVLQRKTPSPKPLAGKTYIGAQFMLGLECVELVEILPSMINSW